MFCNPRNIYHKNTKSHESTKILTLEIFRLYGTEMDQSRMACVSDHYFDCVYCIIICMLYREISSMPTRTDFREHSDMDRFRVKEN